jgi:hypothetical protein
MHEKVNNGVKSLFHDLVTYHASHACTMRTNFDINNSYKCLRLTDDRNQCSIFSGNWWLLRYCHRSGSWPPKSKRASGKNRLTFRMVCVPKTMDKYPELLYEEWKGKKHCLIWLGRMISHMTTNLEMTRKLATNTITRLLLTQSP